jgi:CDP-glucose 4,6-dehydratase
LKLHGEAFNFSNEQKITVLEITNKILKLMKREDLKPKILNQATNEIKDQYLSAKKSRDLLNWRARYTLDNSLKETIGWYRKFFQR